MKIFLLGVTLLVSISALASESSVCILSDYKSVRSERFHKVICDGEEKQELTTKYIKVKVGPGLIYKEQKGIAKQKNDEIKTSIISQLLGMGYHKDTTQPYMYIKY